MAANVRGSPRTLVVWDLTGPRKIHEFKNPLGITGRLWFPDGNTLAVVSLVGKPEGGGSLVRIVEWDLTTGKRDRETDLAPGGSCAISSDGKLIATSDGYPTLVVKVWNTASFQEVATLEAADKADKGYSSAAFSADGSVFVTTGGAGTIKVFDTGTWKEIAKFKARAQPRSLAVSPKGDLVALCGFVAGKPGPDFECFEVATGKPYAKLQDAADNAGTLGGTDFSPDGKLLVTTLSGKGRYLAFWDVATGRQVGKIARKQDREGLKGMRFSPDSKSVATWYDGPGGIELWAVPEIKADK